MNKKTYLMREKDIQIVKDNVNNIIEKARDKEIHTMEPTFDEFKKVRSIILDFIKKEKRIIYGGYAWNSMLKKVSPEDVFYKDNEYTDIEFYSNKPIEDLKKLCDLIADKGFKYIQGKSAQHEETYTIFVNFTGYCDITYIPSNIFYSVMTENIDGLRMIHPKFIMVDLLRLFNNPLTSFWRLDKSIKRGNLMMKNFPLSLKTNTININKLDKSLFINNYLIPKIVAIKSILFIGQIPYNAYIKPNINIKKQISEYNNTLIELISTNLVKDVKYIYNLIIKYFLDDKKMNDFNDNIIFEQYYPFFQFTDKKVIFKYKNEVFLVIYGNNESCIPYNDIKLTHLTETYPIKIATFNVLLMMNLIKYHQAYADRNKDIQNLEDYLMYEMLKSRENFLEANNKTILDDTIFEDFKINCLGIAESPMRKFMLSRRDKKFPRSAIAPYDPEERRQNFPTDSYYYNNTSGNIINNPKDLVYNHKEGTTQE